MSTSSGPANIFSIYAAILCSTSEEKDQFYKALDQVISNIPSTEGLYRLGDFNTRVGADHEAWPSCLGSHGRGKVNENSQQLLEMCCSHHLCMTNPFSKARRSTRFHGDTPTFPPLAPTRPCHHQACRPGQRPPHPQLPYCRQ